MLKKTTKWCVFKNSEIVDAYSTKEQAEFKCEKLENEFRIKMEKLFRKQNYHKKYVAPEDNTYSVAESEIYVFVE